MRHRFGLRQLAFSRSVFWVCSFLKATRQFCQRSLWPWSLSHQRRQFSCTPKFYAIVATKLAGSKGYLTVSRLYPVQDFLQIVCVCYFPCTIGVWESVRYVRGNLLIFPLPRWCASVSPLVTYLQVLNSAQNFANVFQINFCRQPNHAITWLHFNQIIFF